MINRSTVLILGAGASMPVGFPSGYELLRRICISLTPNAASIETSLGGKSITIYAARFRAKLHSIDISETEMNEFKDALWNSGKQSVDAFLEHRPEFKDVGKAAIACELLLVEDGEKLIQATRQKETWYSYLFNILSRGMSDFSENDLAIIDYNYDRSLEHYLFTCLKHSYGMDEEEALDVLRSINFIHIHGQLSDRSYRSPQSVEYGADPTEENLRKAASGIKIIHGDIDGDPEFDHVHRLLDDARVVCFLGFGYDQTNVQRLLVSKFTDNATVYGSLYGFTSAEVSSIKNMLTGSMNPGMYSVKDYSQLDCLRFLRESNVLGSR